MNGTIRTEVIRNENITSPKARGKKLDVFISYTYYIASVKIIAIVVLKSPQNSSQCLENIR